MDRVKSVLVFALSSFFFFTAFQSKAEAVLVIQESYYNGHTYRLIGDDNGSRITWSEAEDYAVSVSGHLATVDDHAENQFIFNTFGPRARTQPSEGSGNRSMWLGLNDADWEGNFVWSSGSTSPYRNWLSGQPQGSIADEDYTGMFAAIELNGQWHDVISDFRFGDVTFGVVEINAVPEPTSIAFAAVSIAAGWTCHRRRMRRTSEALRKKAMS